MEDGLLLKSCKAFAVDVIYLCKELRLARQENVLINQILKSGTSIGANIHEGNYASSRADFINKFQIALKECYETEYWLGLLKETNAITESVYTDLNSKCRKIRKLLASSVTTAKNNTQ